MERLPVIIIGGGPGGLYAALRLAQLGVPALVLERGAYPRDKACGDILTSNVLRAIHALDPAMMQALLAQPWVLPLATTSFGSAHKPGFVMPFHSPANAALGLPACLSARRLDFDQFLAQQALAQPLITLRQQSAVEKLERDGDGYRLHLEGGATLNCDYLLLATGANSTLAADIMGTLETSPKHMALGQRQYYAGVTQAAQGRAEYYLFDRAHMPGGLYLTPFADGTVNVNAVMRLDAWQRTRTRLPELMRGYVEAHAGLAPRFAEAQALDTPMGSRLFLGTRTRAIAQGHCLLIGDAAGLTDATNANGIGHAMISGGLAAEHVAAALQAGASVEAYGAAVQARLRNALRPGRVMKALFSNPVTARAAVGMLNASLNRLNSKAVAELVYSSNTTTTLLDPRFYWRLFAKG